MMQFRVVIPEECGGGNQIVRVHITDGTEANVKIPTGLCPGDCFIFELPDHKMQNPKQLLRTKAASNVMSLSSRPPSSSTAAAIDSICVGGGGRNTSQYNSDDEYCNLATFACYASADTYDFWNNSTKLISSTQRQLRLFFECEIMDFQDIIVLLFIVSAFVSSIIFGFLLGILHVTGPYIHYTFDNDGNMLVIDQQQKKQNSSTRTINNIIDDQKLQKCDNNDSPTAAPKLPSSKITT